MPIFPAVPLVPGVPPVNRAPGSTFTNAVLLTADAVNLVTGFLGGSWGIFNSSGTQVVGQGVGNILSVGGILGALSQAANTFVGNTNNFLDMDFKQRFTISKAPQENGAFTSYNKVQSPYDVAVTVTAGGSESNLALLLTQVASIIASTDLFSVLMPEGPIDGLNPVGYQFRRQHDRGLGLLTVEIFFEQVRPAGNPSFSTTATPSSTGASAATTGGAPPLTNTANPSNMSTSALGTLSPTTPSPQLQTQAGGFQ